MDLGNLHFAIIILNNNMTTPNYLLLFQIIYICFKQDNLELNIIKIGNSWELISPQ